MVNIIQVQLRDPGFEFLFSSQREGENDPARMQVQMQIAELERQGGSLEACIKRYESDSDLIVYATEPTNPPFYGALFTSSAQVGNVMVYQFCGQEVCNPVAPPPQKRCQFKRTVNQGDHHKLLQAHSQKTKHQLSSQMFLLFHLMISHQT